jgi:hypothetical protein
MGFPAADLLGTNPHINRGPVSATQGIQGNEYHFQISVPIQPGNSGGPVFDNTGHVLGMVDSTMNPLQFALFSGSLPQNVNFAIKSSYLQKFLKASHFVPAAGQTNLPLVSATAEASEDRIGRLGKSLVLVRGGLVDEARLKQKSLVCACSYTRTPGGRLVQARLSFVDIRKGGPVMTAEYFDSMGFSENKVLDVVCEQVCDKFFPDKVNPFNPRKSKAAKK